MVINKVKDNENGKNIVLLKSGNTSTCFKHNTFTFSKPITSKKKFNYQKKVSQIIKRIDTCCYNSN